MDLFGELLTGDGTAELVAALLLMGGGVAFTVCALVLGLIDLREHRLPNRIVYPWAGVTAAILLLTSFVLGDGAAAVRALAAAFGWSLAFLGIRLIHPPSIGMGDVKLVFVLGLYAGFLGWETFGAAVVLSFLLGGLVSVGLVVSRRATRSTRIPFGPFLLLGTGLALIMS